MSVTAFYTRVLERLNAQVPAFLGPAPTLPTSQGKVTQCAVLWATAGASRNRANANVADRVDTFTVICVGATALDALAVAGKVREALTGVVTHAGASPIREVSPASAPAAEPNTDPVRVSVALQFTTISKEL